MIYISFYLYILFFIIALPQILVSGSIFSDWDKITKQGAKDIYNYAIKDKKFVWNRIAFICDTFGPRLCGSNGLENALNYIYLKMKEEALLPYKEEVPNITNQVRGEEYARLVFPSIRSKNFTIIGLTGGKNPGVPVTADAIVLKSFDELEIKKDQVKGKIVVFNPEWTTPGGYGNIVQYRYFGAKKAQEYGAVGALVRSATPYSLYTPHAGGTSSETTIPFAAITMEDAFLLERMYGRKQLIVISLKVSVHNQQPATHYNILADIKGKEYPDEYVVVGGHTDSWDITEGATDDMSGSVLSWEVARLLNVLNLTPRRSIRVVLFVNEENGDRGGLQYASDHISELSSTSLMIEADTGSTLPLRLRFKGNQTAFDMVKQVGKTLLSNIGTGNVSFTNGTGSDIGPSCKNGVPCALLEHIDFRDVQNIASNNPCNGFSTRHIDYSDEESEGYFWIHHTSADTVDKLDPDALQLAAATYTTWAWGIANLPTLLPR